MRKVQGYQEKGRRKNYLREPEAQAETGLIRFRMGLEKSIRYNIA